MARRRAPQRVGVESHPPRVAGGSARLASLALLITLATVAGCATSGYHVVASTSTQTFLKVPDGWRVFDQAQIRRHGTQAPPTTLPFLTAFDADPRPSLDHDLSSAAYPFGLVRVRDLSLSEHDQFSLASLRNEVIHVDDLINADANAVQVNSPPRLLTPRGLRGNTLSYTVRGQGGQDFTIEQTGLVDNPTHRVWFLIVGCSATCYRQHQGEIQRVVASWTVEGK